MHKSLLAILVLALAISGTAYAQLPGKFKKAAEDALKDKLPIEGDEAGGETAGESGSRPPVLKDASRKYAPGLSFSSVLNGVTLLAKNGRFDLNHIQTTFIPDDCEGGFVVLRDTGGKELFQYDWKPDRLQKPYTLLNIMKRTDLQTGETSGGGGVELPPGDYVLDFYLPAEHYYTFPFKIEKIGGDDPFGDGQCYVLRGDWERWGYLYYRDAKPDQNLQWKVWLRNSECKEKDIKVRIEIVRDADGELVCTSREHMTHSVQPKWVRLEFDMVFPEGKEVPHGTYFKAQNLLNTDGAYTLTLKIDGAVYGIWKFELEGGQPKYTSRTVRSEADPLSFVEGGRDAFWYERQADK